MSAFRVISVLICGIASITSFAQTVPHRFSPGALIRANELNENFSAVSRSAGTNGNSGTKILVGSTQLGIALSITFTTAREPAIYGLTSTAYLYWIASTEVGLNQRLTMNTLPFAPLVYQLPNCQGTAYIFEFDPQPRYYIFNGFVISDGTKFLMMNPGNPIKSFVPASRLSQNGCQQVPPNEVAARYVELRPNDPTTSGFPNGIPASGPINISLSLQ